MTNNPYIRGPYWLHPDGDESHFPDVESALNEPNGLLAFGGNLTPTRLLHAYQQGIFPWYSEDQPIMWWSPNPRSVLFPAKLRVSRSLSKSLRNRDYIVTFDRAFDDVINACAAPRRDGHGTWLTPEMIVAYNQLFDLGFAHSIECWHKGKLVGGLYGLSQGKVFFGESMFARMTDASKVAFVTLVRQLASLDYQLIDCQVHSAHMQSLGAERISRSEFVELLKRWL